MKRFNIPKLLSFVDAIQTTSKSMPLHAEPNARMTGFWYKTGFILTNVVFLFCFFVLTGVKRISKNLVNLIVQKQLQRIQTGTFEHENPEMLKISDLVVRRKDEGEPSSFHVPFQVTQPLQCRVAVRRA